MGTKTREIYKDNFAEYLLCLALDVGEGMLKNGGEVARVEDTIERICHAYGAVHVEVFSIISFITAGIRMADGSYSSQIRRVRQTSTNLGTLEDLNALSREICRTTPDLDIFDEKLHALKRKRTYPTWVLLAASAIAAGAFTIFFDGDIFDAAVATVIGLVLSMIDIFSGKRINQMAKILISSLVAALMSSLSVAIGVGHNDGAIMIGAIMLLVPGLAFGTAIKDLLCGDLLAGTLKTLQAILAAIMIAFGYMVAGALLGGFSL